MCLRLCLEFDIATYSQYHYKGNRFTLSVSCRPMDRKPHSQSERGPSLPRIDASTLLASSREIILVHNDQEYRLRITSNDKLILTK